MPGKNTIAKLIVGLALLAGFQSLAQNVPAVYKIGQLLNRIHNTSDTIYVVNFWATWCKPCVAELPDFEQFSKDQTGSKVKVLLVTLDFKEDMQTKVMPFLKKTGYTTEVVLLDESNGNVFIDQVSKAWTGAIPATLITTRNRSKQAFFEKKLTAALLLSETQKLQQP